MERFWTNCYQAVVAHDRWKVYVEGLGNTLLITISALMIGIAIGFLVAVFRVYAQQRRTGLEKMIFALCDLYTLVIRGTPVMVQLLILYTAAFMARQSGITVCIIGFGINSGAYIAEVARAGIDSIDRGQMEAGRSLGLSYGMVMRRIILPQAVKNVLPALFNEFIALLKETSVAGYIAVRDLTKAADGIRGITFNSVPLYLTALVYLLLCVGLTQVQKRAEQRLALSDHG